MTTPPYKPPRYWRKLVECPHDAFDQEPEPIIQECMKIYSIDREAAVKLLKADFLRCKYFVNDRYQVEVRSHGDTFVQLNVRRRDGAPIHDWRDLQQIKNELVGEECEAVELYPAESRKVDTSNKYHLWASTKPGWRFPIGFDKRDVQDATDTKVPGLRQRPL